MSEKHTNKHTYNTLTPGEKRAVKGIALVGAALLVSGVSGDVREKVNSYERTGHAPEISAGNPIDWVSSPIAKMVIEVADHNSAEQQIPVQVGRVSVEQDVYEMPPR